MNQEEYIEKALNTLAELCDLSEGRVDDSTYQRRSAAEEILRHYREDRVFAEGITVNVRMDGHVPVRPVMKAGEK